MKLNNDKIMKNFSVPVLFFVEIWIFFNLQIAAGIQINTICATDIGLEAIEGGNNGSPVRFVTIDLSGKVDGDLLPTPSNMFFGRKMS